MKKPNAPTDINVVIAYGLVLMGNIAVFVWGILSYASGTSTGTEIPIAIISSLGGVLTGKHITEQKYAGWTPPPEEKPPDKNPPKENEEKGATQNEENRDIGNQP